MIVEDELDGCMGQCCTEALRRAIWPSPDVLRDANEFRLTELAHAVERFDGDRYLGDAAIASA